MSTSCNSAAPRFPAAVCLGAMLFSIVGCGGDNRSDRDADRAPGDSNKDAIVLEDAMDLWRAGDKDAAIDAFLKIDWTVEDQLADKSPLRMKENDVASRPQGERDEMVAAITAELKVVRELVRATTDDSLPAATKTQRIEAAHNCGAFLLHDPEAAELIRLVGKAFTCL